MDDKLSTSPMHDKQNLPFVDLYHWLKCLTLFIVDQLIRNYKGRECPLAKKRYLTTFKNR